VAQDPKWHKKWIGANHRPSLENFKKANGAFPDKKVHRPYPGYPKRERRAEEQTVEQYVHRTYEAIRQSELSEGREYSFHDLSLVFADVREPVYIGWCHLGESGNEIIAKRMASDVFGLIIANKWTSEQGTAPDVDSAALHRPR
jgi:hypothetical protein